MTINQISVPKRKPTYKLKGQNLENSNLIDTLKKQKDFGDILQGHPIFPAYIEGISEEEWSTFLVLSAPDELIIQSNKLVLSMNKADAKATHISNLEKHIVVVLKDDAKKKSIVYLFKNDVQTPFFNYVVDHPSQIVEVSGLELGDPSAKNLDDRDAVHLLLLIDDGLKYTMQQLYPNSKKYKPIISFNKWDDISKSFPSMLPSPKISSESKQKSNVNSGIATFGPIPTGNPTSNKSTAESESNLSKSPKDSVYQRHLKPTFKVRQLPEYDYFDITLNVEPAAILNLRFKNRAVEWSSSLKDAYKRKNLFDDTKNVRVIVDFSCSESKDLSSLLACLVLTKEGYEVKILKITGVNHGEDHYICNIYVIQTVNLNSKVLPSIKDVVFQSIQFEHLIKRMVLVGIVTESNKNSRSDPQILVLFLTDQIKEKDEEEMENREVTGVINQRYQTSVDGGATPADKIILRSVSQFFQAGNLKDGVVDESIMVLLIGASSDQLLLMEITKDNYCVGKQANMTNALNKCIEPTPPFSEPSCFNVLRPVERLKIDYAGESKTLKTESTNDEFPLPAVSSYQKFLNQLNPEVRIAFGKNRFVNYNIKFSSVSNMRSVDLRTSEYKKKFERIQKKMLPIEQGIAGENKNDKETKELDKNEK